MAPLSLTASARLNTFVWRRDIGFGMRLFDSRWAGAHGIGRFSTELLRRLTGFEPVEISGRPSDPMDPWRVGRHLRKVGADFYFSPGYNAPVGAPCGFAFTVHDLNHLVISENGGALKRLYYKKLVRPALKKASVVFTVSEFSRQQILEWSGMSEDGLVVVRQGVAEEFRPFGDTVKRERPYLLYVGNHRPHKNMDRMFMGFAASGLAKNFEFLATGEPDEHLRSLLKSLKIEAQVHFLGKISDAVLASHYRGARGLVFVSLYEGFGLPIIESMACGTPVLTSNVASMPEVSGGAALLADPRDVDDIAEKMCSLAADEALRENLRTRGLAWSCQYDWSRAALTVGDALSRVR